MTTSNLDLNTNNILQNWDVKKAIKELLANAIDESVETKTSLPLLEFKDNILTISDKGRGLNTKHFTQSINNVKANNPNYIGKFGIGLKDCLAVLYREEKPITIESKYLYVRGMTMRRKTDSKDKTLHVIVEKARDEDFIGTIITVEGVTSSEYRDLKRHFPQFFFSDQKHLIKTEYGLIYAKKSSKHKAIIFINGIRVNEEENFMYHYSITSSNKAIMSVMSGDRDRNKIGKTIYGTKVQQILEEASQKCQQVRDNLLYQFTEIDVEDQYHELKYADIKKLKEGIIAKPKIKIKKYVSSSSEDEEPQKKVKICQSRGEPKSMTLKKKKVIVILSDEEKEDEVGPNITKTTKEQEKFLVEGHNMLIKLFGTSIPILKVKMTCDDESNSNVIYIKAKHFTSLKSFQCKLLSQCIHLCVKNKSKVLQMCKSLVEISSKIK
jgi:hypothetical protein